VINSNWHPISYHFRVITSYCSNFGHLAFWAPFGGLGTAYVVYLGLIGKRVVDFLLMLIELLFARCYGWGTTGENRSQIGALRAGGWVYSKFSHRRRCPPPIIFAQIGQWMPYNFVADSFHTKKLCSRLPSSEERF